LTLDELLAERSRELYNEGMRRNDLIRFGKFVRGTWEFADRSNEQDFRNVYPIPQNQRNVNPNLNQNPGY
jgi:starch-binding outer membrane protein, SusD/RagB family